MGTRIVVMKDGFIQQVDTPQHLYDKICNMFVAGFIGSPQMNFIDATLKKVGSEYALCFDKYQIIVPSEKTKGGVLDPYVGKEVVFGIRPEYVREPEFLAKCASILTALLISLS